jgi:hypothetical protein
MRRAIADAIYMAYVVRREKVDGSSAAETAVSESSFPS